MKPITRSNAGVVCHLPVFVLGLLLLVPATLHASTLLYWNGSAPNASASGTWNMNTNNLTWSTNNDERLANDPNPECYQPQSAHCIPVFANGNATDGLPGPYTVTVDNSYGQVYITDMHCDVGPLTLTGGMICWYSDAYGGPGYNLISAQSTNVFTVNCVLSNLWNSTDGTAFHKYKTGTLILGATNAWVNESVMIEGGTIMISADQCFPANTGLMLGNGDGRSSDGFVDTPPIFNSGGHNQNFGALTLTGPDDTIPRTIDFSNRHGALSFANSSGVAWTTVNNASNSANPGPIMLTITNFSTATAKLRFGTDDTGLTTNQLNQIEFADYLDLPGVIDTNGYVTPALPIIQSVSVSGTSVQITWSVVPNWTYDLEYQTSLTSPWQSLGNYSSNGNSITAFDTLSPPARYYRVQVLPQ